MFRSVHRRSSWPLPHTFSAYVLDPGCAYKLFPRSPVARFTSILAVPLVSTICSPDGRRFFSRSGPAAAAGYGATRASNSERCADTKRREHGHGGESERLRSVHARVCDVGRSGACGVAGQATHAAARTQRMFLRQAKARSKFGARPPAYVLITVHASLASSHA